MEKIYLIDNYTSNGEPTYFLADPEGDKALLEQIGKAYDLFREDEEGFFSDENWIEEVLESTFYGDPEEDEDRPYTRAYCKDYGLDYEETSLRKILELVVKDTADCEDVVRLAQSAREALQNEEDWRNYLAYERAQEKKARKLQEQEWELDPRYDEDVIEYEKQLGCERGVYIDGRLVSDFRHKDMHLDRVDVSWYDNGNLRYRVHHKEGHLDGLHETWYYGGEMRSRLHFRNGHKDGLDERWYEFGNRKRSRVNYKDDERDGLSEEWYSNGQLKNRGNYKAGKRDGLREEWHENGQPKVRETYKAGTLDGLREEWHENGQPKVRETYKAGKRVGLCQSWTKDGRLDSRSVYKEGEEVFSLQASEIGHLGELIRKDPLNGLSLFHYQPVRYKNGWLQRGLDGLVRKYDGDPSGISDEVSSLAKELSYKLKDMLNANGVVTRKELSKYIRIAAPEIQRELGKEPNSLREKVLKQTKDIMKGLKMR